jgi:hypothetical protein
MTTEVANRIGALQAPQLDYILIDGSGSMQDKWWESLGALDAFIDVLKSQNVNSHGIITVFDSHDVGFIARNSTIDTWQKFSVDPIGAHWGSTPLYDAINNMGRELKDLDPPRASIVIVTDGDENGSKYTTVDQARAILDWCRAKGWQVTFLGADFNNSRQARLLGADDSNSLGVQKALMNEAGKTLGKKRAIHAITGADINFSEQEKKDFGGYLTDQSAK